MNIDYNGTIEILKSFLENEKTEILGISVGEERQVRDAIKNILTAYEKEALRNFKSEYETCDHYSSDLIIELDDAEIILNLIEKQSKEIEELKDKCKELIFEKQELTSALLDSTPNDKIKATIEELDKDENASIPDFIEYAKEYATQKLQSLLEKE